MPEVKVLGNGADAFLARFEAQRDINERCEKEISDIYERIKALETEGTTAVTEIKNISKSLTIIETEVKKITEWKYTISGALIALNLIVVVILVPLAIKIWGK